MVALTLEQQRPVSPEQRRQYAQAQIRRELEDLPGLNESPIKLSTGDGSRLSEYFTRWLDRRRFGDLQLDEYVLHALTDIDMARRMRAVEAVWLHYAETFTQEDVAELLRVNVATVRADIRRAVEWLAERRLMPESSG